MGFFKFICDWGEQVFEYEHERIMKLYNLKEVSLDDTPAVISTKSVKPVQTVKKLNVQEAHN